MVNFRFFILLSLILIPSYIFASESDRGGREPQTASAQHGPSQESPVIEPAKTPEHHAIETQEHKSEMPAPAAHKEQTAVTSYSSNPVAAKAVDRNISLFTERIKERFSLWLSRSGRYVEMMKDILKAKGIPEDIAFLPLIESGFSPSAYSVARAVGQWQFIAATAKRYGLKIDWWRDERKDPVKSTAAAANYLKDLYEMFGSWNLAMAAYNAGEGKILRAVNRTKSDDYWALLNTTHIKRETKEYVPRFIAARMIANNPDDYGFENIDYHQPFEYDEVLLNGAVDLEVAARCADTTVETIRELNPELRRWSTPPYDSYVLRIPAGKKDVFTENLMLVPEEERFSIATYIAQKGDTLKSIAIKVGVPINVLLELNGDIRSLKAGEKVHLPPKEKFHLDRDDKAKPKKASLNANKKKSKSAQAKRNKNKKLVVASINKDNKEKAYND